MKRFVQGESRTQGTLLPELLDDYIAENNPIRVIDVFVDELDLGQLGFEGVAPALTGRPSYHPAVLLKAGRDALLYFWSRYLHRHGVKWCITSRGNGMATNAKRTTKPRSEPKTVRASVSFPRELYATLERMAERQKVSVAWIVRDAAEKYVGEQWPLFAEKGKGG